MQSFTFTAVNSKQLSAQLDQFNETLPQEHRLYLNWGRQGGSRWFANSQWGSDTKTGLSFHEVVEYVQRKADLMVCANPD